MESAARLEVETDAGVETVPLVADRMTIGRGHADVTLTDDTVSGLHATVERVTGGWIVQDLGSRNGTFVNGTRLMGPRALRGGDELRLGASRIIFVAGDTADEHRATEPLEAAPALTQRERDLLVALCRPLLRGSVLAEPAGLRAIAAELVVSESAVKKLLSRTFDKFRLGGAERRRHHLALEALRRGAVSIADLEPERV